MGIAKRFAKEKRRKKSKGKVRNGYSFSNAKSCEKQQLGSGQQQHNNRKKKNEKNDKKFPTRTRIHARPTLKEAIWSICTTCFPYLTLPHPFFISSLFLSLSPFCLPLVEHCPPQLPTPFPPSISSPRRDRRASRRFLPLSSRAGMCIASRVASDRLPWSAQCEE